MVPVLDPLLVLQSAGLYCVLSEGTPPPLLPALEYGSIASESLAWCTLTKYCDGVEGRGAWYEL